MHLVGIGADELQQAFAMATVPASVGKAEDVLGRHRYPAISYQCGRLICVFCPYLGFRDHHHGSVDGVYGAALRFC